MQISKAIDNANNLGYLIRSVSRSFDRILDFELKRSVGIPVTYWRIISSIVLDDIKQRGHDSKNHSSQGLTQKEIAEFVGVEAPTLVPIIDNMVKEGFVERRQDPTDRRNNRIFLTGHSNKLWNAALATVLRVRDIALHGVSGVQLDTTKRALEQIAKNIQLLEKEGGQETAGDQSLGTHESNHPRKASRRGPRR